MPKDNEPKIWNYKTELILKQWAEKAACYRVMHNKAYEFFKIKNRWFVIPVIIFSTLTGCANFSQGALKGDPFEPYFPIVIGSVNLFAGMLSTIHQTLKYPSLEEGHRLASNSFGKLSRNISVEIGLPPQDRNSHGVDYLRHCRAEFDKLLEQSPHVPRHIVMEFNKIWKDADVCKPEILSVIPVKIYSENSFMNKIKEISDTSNDEELVLELNMDDHKLDKDEHNLDKDIETGTN